MKLFRRPILTPSRCALMVALCTAVTVHGPIAAAALKDAPGRMLPVAAILFENHVEDLHDHMWLGLYAGPQGYSLRAATPTAIEVPYEAFDGPDDPPSGRKITVESNGSQPYFLFTGLDGLREGPVHTVFDGAAPLRPGTLLLGHHAFVGAFLEVEGERSEPGHDNYAQYSLTLATWGEKATHRQVLVAAESTYYCVPRLLWAGDLDGDGRMDLILDVQTDGEGSTSRLQLLLSTLAEDDALVGLAAEIVYGGC